MASYPTPPPTTSPKSKNGSSYRTSDRKGPAQDSYFKDSYSKPAEPDVTKVSAQDTYYQQAAEPKLPGQDTYYHESYSKPAESKVSAQDTHYQESYITAQSQLPAQDTYHQESYTNPAESKLPAQVIYFEQSHSKPAEPVVTEVSAQDAYYQKPAEPKLPAQDAYYHEPYNRPAEPKVPAQDASYHQSYSTPASPTHWDPSSKPVPTNNINAASTVHFDHLPPRPMSSSPVQYPGTYPQEPFPRPSSTGVSPNTTPLKYPFPPPRRSSRSPPRPLYSSPLNPIPSPYNASRPQPRPGFLRRIAQKVERWIRTFMQWSSKNPIKAGMLTFIPVLATAGIVRAARGVGKLFGGAKGGVGKVAGLRAADKQAKKEWGYGLDEFIGFGGAKGGHPVSGLLRLLQMLMNHYCRFTPSAFPRLASILLELHFLDTGKAKV